MWLWAVGTPMSLEVTLPFSWQALSTGHPDKEVQGAGHPQYCCREEGGQWQGRPCPPGLATPPGVTRTSWLFPYLLQRVPSNNEEEILSPQLPRIHVSAALSREGLLGCSRREGSPAPPQEAIMRPLISQLHPRPDDGVAHILPRTRRAMVWGLPPPPPTSRPEL